MKTAYGLLVTEGAIVYISNYFSDQNSKNTSKIIRLNINKHTNCQCLKVNISFENKITPIMDVVFKYQNNIRVVMNIGTTLILKGAVIYFTNKSNVRGLAIYHSSLNKDCTVKECCANA